MPRPRKPANPFRYFYSSPEVIRLVGTMYAHFPLSLRSVEDLLFERGMVFRVVPVHPIGDFDYGSHVACRHRTP